MTERLVLGIDLGSSAAKGVVADEHGRILAQASVPQTVSRSGPGIAEQDPADWWRAVCELAAAMLARLRPMDRSNLAGVSISGHLPTLLLVDSEGTPLGPALLYGDQRGDPYVEEAAALTGEALVGDEWLPKLLWLAANRADLLGAARLAFNPHDYVAWRLTGLRGLDFRTARRLGGLLDPIAREWRPDLAARLGLDPRALPPLRSGGEILGSVTPAAAGETGIPARTPVVVGLGDTPAELIGAGVVRPGDVLVYYGTTTTFDLCTHDFGAYLRDPKPIAEWAPYDEVGYAVIGPALSWIAAGLVPEGPDDRSTDIRRLDALAAELEPTVESPYVIPNFLAHARPGAPVRRPAIVGLDARHGRADLHRAVLESFAFVGRAGLEAADSAATGGDSEGRRFIATGGGARSGTWLRLVSNVLGAAQVHRPHADAALGSAALAAWATCDADVFGTRDRGWGTEGESIVEVEPDVAALEEARYRCWRRIRDVLATVDQLLEP